MFILDFVKCRTKSITFNVFVLYSVGRFCADFARRHQQYQTIVRQQLQITAQPFVMWLAMLYPLFLGSFWDEKSLSYPKRNYQS